MEAEGFINVALDKGYRLAFKASSDHVSTHTSYCNLIVKDLSRASVLDAFQKRHVYAATDNILADVESGSHLMGDEFSAPDSPSLFVKLKGTSSDLSNSPGDNKPSRSTGYYYVRGDQDDGEIVWASPLWITHTGK